MAIGTDGIPRHPMYDAGMRTRSELLRFVDALPISQERREVLRMELEDHVFEAMAELEAAGTPRPDAEQRAVEALGSPEEMRQRLLGTELAFSLTPMRAFLLGMRAGVPVAAV